MVILYLSGWNEMGPIRTMKCKGLCENKGICLVPEKKIMWEEQLVDPRIDYITYVNAL